MEFVYKLLRDLIGVVSGNINNRNKILFSYIDDLHTICVDLIETKNIGTDKAMFIREQLVSYSSEPSASIRNRLSNKQWSQIKTALMGARTFYWIKVGENISDAREIVRFVSQKHNMSISHAPISRAFASLNKDNKTSYEQKEYKRIIEPLKSLVLNDVAQLSLIKTEIKAQSNTTKT